MKLFLLRSSVNASGRNRPKQLRPRDSGNEPRHILFAQRLHCQQYLMMVH
jgi:hypothetical protein